MKKLLVFTVFILIFLDSSIGQKRFWISPASVRSDFWQMFGLNEKWDTLLTQIDVFSIHVNALDGNRLDTGLLSNAIRKFKNAGVLVNFECGGLRPFSGCDTLAGERHAQLELNNLYKWYSRGGSIDIITMDSPINTMIQGGDPSGTCNWSVERTAGEIADYMKSVKKFLPNVKFAIVEPIPWYRIGNYPNYPGNNYGDLLLVLDTVFSILEDRGEKIEIFHSDSPYEYSNDFATSGWKKIKVLEDWLHTKGVRHGRIHNSSLGGASSSKLFYENTLDSYIKYKQEGGNPDEIEVWSWYPYPDKNTPETENYSFTNTCKKFFEFVLSQNESRILLEPEDGFVYHGVQTSTFEAGPDPLAGYLGALNDSTIHPAVRGYFFSIPGTRGPSNAFTGLDKFLHTADSIGYIPEISLFLVSDIATDSLIAYSNQYDWIIDSIINRSKAYGKRMFVRIGGEFNGQGPNWNGGGYHPYHYPVMFRKIVDRYQSLGFRDSVAIIWCYEPDAANDFDSTNNKGVPKWYPGDKYVDWFGLDVFDADHFDQALPDFNRTEITKKGKSERFLAMARLKSKPVYLSESSAKSIHISADATDGLNDWNQWFAKFWQFISVHTEIKGFSYINANWPVNAYPNWGDARIQNNLYITNRYKEEMKKSKYIHLKTSSSSPILDTIPLNELGLSSWKNQAGGLYENGLNNRPLNHEIAGVSIANSIVPLNDFGIFDEANGKIVLLSIGMSNATQEYSVFKQLTDTFKLKNPKVIIVDGAQGGQTAAVIKDPNANFWSVINQRLSQQNLNPLQVQTVWLKEANANPTMAFPKHAQDLKADLKTIVKILKTKYPNLKLVYLSSRIYGGYANTPLNPEPYAYESGFSVKWLINDQIQGDTALAFSGRNPNAPWLSWGPYLWAKGSTARADGLTWQFSDFVTDGTHPSNSGRLKVAKMLLDFFSTDSTSIPWFLRKNSTNTFNESNAENPGLTLYQNQPNPFSCSTKIHWKTENAAHTSMNLLDYSGKIIMKLVDKYQFAGEHTIEINFENKASGIYFIKLIHGKQVAIIKLIHSY
ncbi:MAG: T9SS type A sorting domain-containing protein [Saprospiraceae bacterium]|nr:T9SS type A sorting domain-containing protein [Saprospiraceae bacterium]